MHQPTPTDPGGQKTDQIWKRNYHILNLNFADLLDLLLRDTFEGVGGGGGGHLLQETARQSGDDNCAVVAGTH